MNESDYQKIPLKVLKKELPDLKRRGRRPYIDELKSVNKEKLDRLASYFSINNSTSLYIYKLKLVDDKILLSMKNLQKLLNKKIQNKSGAIFIVKEVNINTNRNEAYLKIDGYSSQKTLSAVLPDTLEHFRQNYRRDFTTGLIVHLDKGHVECRTGYETRASTSINILSKAIYQEENQFEIVILDKSKQDKINNSSKAKKATISGLSWNGSETIRLEGDDVERTIEEFRRKKINFESMGATISLDNRKSEEGFTFFSDGKIIFKKKDYPYDEIKNVI